MSETLETPPAKLTPAEAQISETKAYFASIGLDPSLVDKAVSIPGPADATLRVADLDTVKALQASGQSDAAIAEALARAGLKAPVDERTESQIAFDRVFGPPPSPSDYKPVYYGRLDEIQDLGAYHAEATTALAAMGLPVGVGEYIVEKSLDIGKWFKDADEPTRELWMRGERYDLEEKYGIEGAALYVQKAAEALAKAGPAFMERLKASGALHSREIVAYLALQGARTQRRNEG
jgi:hypothetical protein